MSEQSEIQIANQGSNQAPTPAPTSDAAVKIDLDAIGRRLGGYLDVAKSAAMRLAERAKAAEAGWRDAAAAQSASDAPAQTFDGQSSYADWRSQFGGARAPAEPEPEEDPAAARPAAIAIDDRPDAWTLAVDLPGVRSEEVEVRAEAGRLLIETTGARRFAADAILPPDIPSEQVAEKAQTWLADGVLKITLPRGSAPVAPPTLDQRI